MCAFFRRTGEPDPLRAEEVRHTQFRVTTLREGYDQNGVDAFLAQVEETLQADTGPTRQASQRPELTVEDVETVRFRTTRFREGYNQDEVDAFLARVVTELRRRDPHR